MERVHQLVATDNVDAKDADFWIDNWQHIASAKVTLETKVAVYKALRHRGVADISDIYVKDFYEMVRADRAFVAALDLSLALVHCYRLLIMWLDDDDAALTAYYRTIAENRPSPQSQLDLTENGYSMRNERLQILLQINPPRCMRFLLQDEAVRVAMTREQLSPLAQRLLEELALPTDRLNRKRLLLYGHSVKLIGMCVKDDELVAAWLAVRYPDIPPFSRRTLSATLARKLYALATPDQKETLKGNVSWELYYSRPSEGCFELAWLFGLLGPDDPKVQECFREYNVSLFPALTFAMIVAMCDGYLEAMRSRMSEAQRRFFTLAARLPMDLQAVVALRLYGRAATVIQGETFDRAFLAVV
jgi:hypothetical protein